MEQKDRKTRRITIGRTKVGGDAPVVVQSMCATRTIDVDETVAQAHQLANAGAGIVRIAMDSEKEIPALKEIRRQTKGVVLSVDLQENYKIADRVAPHVDKIRYNPGDQLAAIVESAAYHCDLMDQLGFPRFVVSLKDSDPNKVMDANRRFSQ